MRRVHTILVGLVLTVGLGVVVAACGSNAVSSGGGVGTVSGAGLQGLVLRPAKPAPGLALRSYTGARVVLARLKGRAVFVTFVYTHCPDVCPLIVSSLGAAQRQLGRQARHVAMLAVTVDPRRDTPNAIRTFLRARDATGRIDYLLGTGAQLRRIWKAWGVAVQLGNGRVTNGHSAVVYGIAASGRLAVVYPSNFSPAQIVHDVSLLFGS